MKYYINYSCIALATFTGFRIYSVNPFQLLYKNEVGPISIIEMLYKTNIVLLVGLTEYSNFSPKRITIWTTLKNTVLCISHHFTSKIIIAKINKERMIIGDKNYLHIYETKSMNFLYSYVVSDITLGNLILSKNSEKNNWFCYSTSKDEGMVNVYDAMDQKGVKVQIKAHKSPVFKMCLNYEGDRLATCSCKGTIIRVFSLPKGDKLCTFKRGVSPAFIFCLNFSRNSEKLVETCENGFLHVFDIKEEMENLEKKKEPKGFIKVLGRGISSALSSFVPKEYEDSFGTQGAAMVYYNDRLKMTNLVGFCDDDIKEIFCFTSDGTFSTLKIDNNTKTITKDFEKNIKEII
jgi:WD40 repeat protein